MKECTCEFDSLECPLHSEICSISGNHQVENGMCVKCGGIETKHEHKFLYSEPIDETSYVLRCKCGEEKIEKDHFDPDQNLKQRIDNAFLAQAGGFE